VARDPGRNGELMHVAGHTQAAHGQGRGPARRPEWPTSSPGPGRTYTAIHPNANGQAYQNYLDPDLVNWQRAYFGANYPMLQKVKATYDPPRRVHVPQAITAA
jgi:Berberine and berberine like